MGHEEEEEKDEEEGQFVGRGVLHKGICKGLRGRSEVSRGIYARLMQEENRNYSTRVPVCTGTMTADIGARSRSPDNGSNRGEECRSTLNLLPSRPVTKIKVVQKGTRVARRAASAANFHSYANNRSTH